MVPAIQLDPVEARVLGVLIEKEFTTPEQYPLSLNALVNGCNQKSNRDPELAVSEHEVSQAILRLRVAQLVDFVQLTGQRVEKYRHRAGATLHAPPLELAVLAELLLRGSQQPNELARRAERMQPAATPETVQAALTALMGRQLVVHQERRSGERFSRYAQVLAAEGGGRGVGGATGGGGGVSVASGGADGSGGDVIRRPDVGSEAARVASGMQVSAGVAQARGAAPGQAAGQAHGAAGIVPAVSGLRPGVLAVTAPAGASDLVSRVTALEAEVASLNARVRVLATRLGETLQPD